METFSFSQFHPNNINHALGCSSLFVYDFGFSPLNRRGRQTHKQMQRNELIRKKFGAYPFNTIELGAEKIFRRIHEKSEGCLTLHTDGHHAYKRALKRLSKSARAIDHQVTSSRAARNFQNKLFPINHMDLICRQRSSAFKRETVSFSKHSIAMLERYALLVVDKNFLRPKFEKPHARDPKANLDSPAMRLGIEKKILKFRDFFRTRLTKSHVALNEDWKNLFERNDPLSRRPIQAYLGI